MVSNITVGVLSLQGAFAEHIRMLRGLNADTFEIRNADDLRRRFSGLVIPGGESTAISKLLDDLGMTERLRDIISSGIPVLGTCAGLILLAKRVEGGRPSLATMDITAKRNAYGRQLGSFNAAGKFADMGVIPMTFIRAPFISDVGCGVSVLSEYDGRITAARQDNQLALSFHPELTDDDSVHRYFLDMISETV